MAMSDSNQTANQDALVSTRAYYEAAFLQFGASSKGVDWPTEHGQVARFQELDKLWQSSPDASLCDFGCGYGAYLPHLRLAGFRGSYIGVDLSPQMIQFAKEQSSTDLLARFLVDDEPQEADFVVASGIFNVVTSGTKAEWEAHTERMLDGMCSRATIGIAFNALLEPTPPFRVRADLFWIDPQKMLTGLADRGFTSTLICGYGLHEATYIARRLNYVAFP
jgi:hypothetical protein